MASVDRRRFLLGAASTAALAPSLLRNAWAGTEGAEAFTLCNARILIGDGTETTGGNAEGQPTQGRPQAGPIARAEGTGREQLHDRGTPAPGLMHLRGRHHPGNKGQPQGGGALKQRRIKHRRDRIGQAGRRHLVESCGLHDRGRPKMQQRELLPQRHRA